MPELLFGLATSIGAYIAALALARRMALDPKPKGALVICVTLFAGVISDVAWKAFMQIS